MRWSFRVVIAFLLYKFFLPEDNTVDQLFKWLSPFSTHSRIDITTASSSSSSSSPQSIKVKTPMEHTTYKLPPLPYAYDALEPHVSKQIMELHHSKHHQTYVNNLNAALENQINAIKHSDIPQQIANQQAIKFNGGGHINHSLFWHNLAPAKENVTDSKVAPKLLDAIKQQWGTFEEFQDKFEKTLLGIQGSGWGWLVKNNDSGRLSVVTTKDQDPVDAIFTPIIGVDMWEHAYYLDYLNAKPKYIENMWKILNFETAEERFLGSRPDAFKVLRASM